MFAIALLIGIYSNAVTLLGFTGFLYKNLINIFTFIFITAAVYIYRLKIRKSLLELSQFFINLDIVEKTILFLILILFSVNLFGALSPETAFDPLWYHLTIPKIFLINHSISYFQSGLFYYLTMPKLVETLYIGVLSFSNDIAAHSVQLTFGILALVTTYKISRLYFDKKLSLISALIFYSNIVVAWESTAAFVDLGRTFFEAVAFYSLVLFFFKKEKKYFYLSAIILGLQISSKLIGLADILIFTLLLFYSTKNIRDIVKYLLVSVFIPLPWFVFSFLSTGNPIYPILSKAYPKELSTSLLNPIVLLNPINILKDSFGILVRAQDPISPIYLVAVPLIILVWKEVSHKEKYLILYSLLSFIVWYITPKTGGGRFIMTYLPVFSVVSVIPLFYLKDLIIKRTFLLTIIFLSIVSIFYRGIAESKFLPVFLGRETRSEYLTKRLNFNFGDFYDTDGYFKNHIKSSDKVLLYGFHNLYYVDFPYIDSSWVSKGDQFNYIATQGSLLNGRFSFFNLIYYNPTTQVRLYSAGGRMWTY